MESKALDCTWCGSARSIEHGLCQVCLMEYPQPITAVIPMPRSHRRLPSPARELEAAGEQGTSA